MIASSSILIKTLLATGAIAAFSPLLLSSYRRFMIWGISLSVSAFLIECLTVTYFYIYSGRTNWTMAQIGPIEINFSLEPLGLIFLNLLSGLWIIAVIYTFFYMRSVKDVKYTRFLTFIGLAIFASSIVALSSNLFVMFMGYEALTLSTIPLVAHYGISQPQITTYFRTLIFSSLGLFLPAIFIVDFYTGSTQFGLDSTLGANINILTGNLLLFLFIFGIAKTAIYPLYKWLPAAMVAPYPVSALLHAVAVVKTGLFCIFKIIIYVFGFDYLYDLISQFNWPLMIAILTMLFASYKAVMHDSIKNILAYSTVSQLSLTLSAAFLFTEKSMYASIAHMISHSFAKVVLFFTAGRFYAAIGCSRVEQLKGLAYKLPVPAIFFIIGSFSLIGIHPFAGSYSKNLIMEEILKYEYGGYIAATIYISTLCTMWYLVRIIYNLFGSSAEEIVVESSDPNSIFAKFHQANSYFMDLSIAMCCIAIAAFPIIEKFLGSMLYGIL